MHVGVWEDARPLGSGFAWQAWGFVHCDVAEHAFRVAGVGDSCILTLLSVRFAWQV